MNDAFTGMPGVEFESICLKLIQKMGFSVENTKQTGDGGIDLIAHNNQPITRGTYIVQCKRYSGNVGEPIIRDLYGVVTSARANKGVLITTGHFTENALMFAEGKNLELIDGREVRRLLNEYGLLNSILVKEEPSSFLEFPDFDSEKYGFYLNLKEQGAMDRSMASEFVLDFMFGYLMPRSCSTPPNWALIHSGLVEEFIAQYNWFTKKYYSRGKNNKLMLHDYDLKYRSVAQLYHFDLFDYAMLRYPRLANKENFKVSCYRNPGEQYQHLNTNRYCIAAIPEPYLEDAIYSLAHLDSMRVRTFNGKQRGGIHLEYWTEDSVIDRIRNGSVHVITVDTDPQTLNVLNLLSALNDKEAIAMFKARLFGSHSQEEWVNQQWPFSKTKDRVTILVPKSFGWYSSNKYAGADYGEILDVQPYYNAYASEHKDKIERELIKIRTLLRSSQQP